MKRRTETPSKDIQESKMTEHGNGGCGNRSHFLVVAYSIQGHLNPARALARRLARASGSAATLSIPASGHRRMFPSLEPSAGEEEVSDGVISYIPFSDGVDDGSWPKNSDERASRRRANLESLSAVLDRLAAAGRPVTCVVSTLSIPAAAKVARDRGIPLALYWIQPATALALYYHYFHGHAELMSSLVAAGEPTSEVSLPGLRPLSVRDIPTFFFDETSNVMSKMILDLFQELFTMVVDRDKPMFLVNSFGALEGTVMEAIRPYLDVLAVGPSAAEAQIHLFREDEKRYMEWLDAQPEKSVVYVSFGSLLTYSERQAEEISRALRSGGRPYLWVARGEEVERCSGESPPAAAGMVVEWCEQLQVLSHPAVGCFVTHCGWNSTLEAVAAGVPMVAAPSWSDQPMNAFLVEQEWGVGVRAERDADGVLAGAELAKCVELVMGGTARAATVRANAAALKERAREAIALDGPSERNLRSFVARTRTHAGRSG